ncbi:hypothetical protein BD410DRAFT_417344 [Rickenella mellea]|uniref:Uncharacterized protein n=1 Tax=Rickenella mellea TaxID=50990 RepID=A0A4Y7QKL9_9AGAM|nr:hypothetical protein BD410DRAFT_417344 [Rickenella mellea]
MCWHGTGRRGKLGCRWLSAVQYSKLRRSAGGGDGFVMSISCVCLILAMKCFCRSGGVDALEVRRSATPEVPNGETPTCCFPTHPCCGSYRHHPFMLNSV